MNKKHINKITIIAAITGLAAVFVIFDLGQYLSLSYFRESREKFQALYSGHRAAVIAGYMTVYILVTSLSLPGEAVMTVAGGACG